MMQFGITIYPNENNVFEWIHAGSRVRGFIWEYPEYSNNKTHIPVVVFFVDEKSRDTFASAISRQFPGVQFGCFKMDAIYMAPPGEVKKFSISEKGILPT
jgi:hypothetical protein